MMIHLQPVRWRTRNPSDSVISWKWDQGMVLGPQIERNHESRKSGCKSDLNEASFGVSIWGCSFVIEKALNEMAEQMGKLTPRWFTNLSPCRLRLQREDLGFRHHEEALESFTHGRYA